MIRLRRCDWILIVIAFSAVACVHVAGRVGAYCSPLKGDSYIYASFGYRVAHGDVFYRDMSDIKPPGHAWLNAVAYSFGGWGRSALIPLESLFLVAAYAAFYALGKRWYGHGVGLCVMILGVVTINYLSVTGKVIEGFGLTENYMILPALLAALCYVRSLNGNAKWLVATGIFLGLEGLLKQTAIALTIAVFVHWVWTIGVWRREWLRCVRGASLVIAGGLIVWIPVSSILWWQGVLFKTIPLLTGQAATMASKGTGWPSQWMDVLPLWPALIWGAWAVVHGALAWKRRENIGRDTYHQPTGFLVIWAAAELFMLWNMPLRSSHYFVLTSVPLILLTGAFWAMYWRVIREKSTGRRQAGVAVAVVLTAAACRPVVDIIVPVAMARYRTYDWASDRQHFDAAIHWGRIHFGEGPPFIAED